MDIVEPIIRQPEFEMNPDVNTVLPWMDDSGNQAQFESLVQILKSSLNVPVVWASLYHNGSHYLINGLGVEVTKFLSVYTDFIEPVPHDRQKISDTIDAAALKQSQINISGTPHSILIVPFAFGNGPSSATIGVLDTAARIFDSREIGLVLEVARLAQAKLRSIYNESKIRDFITQNKVITKLLRDSPDGVIWIDLNRSKILYRNIVFDQIWNLVDDECDPNNFSALLHRIHELTVSESVPKLNYFSPGINSKKEGAGFKLQLRDGRTIACRIINLEVKDPLGANQIFYCRDITSESESRRRMLAVLDAVDRSALVSVTDKSGVIIKVNSQFCEISKFTESELIGKQHSIVNSGYHPAEFWTQMWQTIRAGKTWRDEVKNRAKDGSDYWVDTVINPILDQRGNIESFFSIRYLIDDKKLQEQELISSKFQLEEANRIAHIGRWDFNIRTNELKWTQSIFDLFELDPEKFKSTYEGFLATIHPDDREAVNRAYIDSLQTREAYDIQHRLLMPDGRIKWVIEKCHTKFDEHGNPLKSIGIVQDITALKNAEIAASRASSMLDKISSVGQIGGWDLDVQQKDLLWSEVTRFIYEVSDSYFPVYTDLYKFLNSEQSRLAMKSLLDSAIRKGQAFTDEFELRTAQNSVIWVQIIGQPEMIKGKCVRVFGTISNITERKRFEQEFTRAREEAENSNRAKSDFLSSMSHELRTPMNAILGFAQLLEMNIGENLHERDIDNIGEIISAGNHLLELINEVLDLSRIESGGIELSLENVRLVEVMEDLQGVAEALARSSGVSIEFHCKDHEQLVVKIDRLRIKQVILNIVSNAIKYNVPGGQVLVACQVASREKVRISVKDTGVGISRENQKKLFQPFQRLGAENSVIEGTGIGLMITRKLVELMACEISLESEVGTGSTFFVDVPRAEGSIFDNVKTANKLPSTRIGREWTALYIGDNPVNIRLMTKFFAKYFDVELITAHSGFIAGDIARSKHIHLFLVDLDLLGVECENFINNIKKIQLYREVPFIGFIDEQYADRDSNENSNINETIIGRINFEKLREYVVKLLD